MIKYKNRDFYYLYNNQTIVRFVQQLTTIETSQVLISTYINSIRVTIIVWNNAPSNFIDKVNS